uniref:Uncharacterized protein n=1 Tax=Knipowitschia caucasica TaxID=637954 RepID=A0AAV2M8X1_KNICA
MSGFHSVSCKSECERQSENHNSQKAWRCGQSPSSPGGVVSPLPDRRSTEGWGATLTNHTYCSEATAAEPCISSLQCMTSTSQQDAAPAPACPGLHMRRPCVRHEVDGQYTT